MDTASAQSKLIYKNKDGERSDPRARVCCPQCYMTSTVSSSFDIALQNDDTEMPNRQLVHPFNSKRNLLQVWQTRCTGKIDTERPVRSCLQSSYSCIDSTPIIHTLPYGPLNVRLPRLLWDPLSNGSWAAENDSGARHPGDVPCLCFMSKAESPPTLLPIHISYSKPTFPCNEIQQLMVCSVIIPSLILSHQYHVVLRDCRVWGSASPPNDRPWPRLVGQSSHLLWPQGLVSWVPDMRPKRSQPEYSLKLNRAMLGRRSGHCIELVQLRRFWEGLGIPVAVLVQYVEVRSCLKNKESHSSDPVAKALNLVKT